MMKNESSYFKFSMIVVIQENKLRLSLTIAGLIGDERAPHTTSFGSDEQIPKRGVGAIAGQGIGTKVLHGKIHVRARSRHRRIKSSHAGCSDGSSRFATSPMGSYCDAKGGVIYS
jgi:hypothetical protein